MATSFLARVAAAALVFAPTVQLASAQTARPQQSVVQGIALEAGAGRVVHVNGAIANLFAADPKVVDVRPVSHNAVFIFATGTGRTTVAALDDSGNLLAQFDVTVNPSSYGAGEAAAKAARTAPSADAHYAGTMDGVSVTGTASTPLAAEQASAVAHDFVSDKQVVSDRMNLNSSVQVTLRVRIAEISRTITRQLGINWSAAGNIGRWGVASSVTDGLSSSSNPPNTVTLASPIGSNCVLLVVACNVSTTLDLLAQDQLITMLAEPNLTTRSGEPASFLAGGEFPIPVSGQNGQITLAFKQYGVSLAFVPTVLTDGRISLHVHPEVSQLTNVGAVSLPIATSLFGTSVITVPAITIRRADTTVELGSGQSFAIAGLLQSDNNMDARGLPYAGELPVLGALFKSDAFQRDQSELVIVVTPYIVKPVSVASQLQSPTDDFVPAGDKDRLLLMRQRALGTGPSVAVRPSVVALKAASPGTANDLPDNTAFILH